MGGKQLKLNVNGERFAVPRDSITAGELKEEWGAPSDHWVFAKSPSGSTKQLQDHESLGPEVDSISIVPPYEEGGIETERLRARRRISRSQSRPKRKMPLSRRSWRSKRSRWP